MIAIGAIGTSITTPGAIPIDPGAIPISAMAREEPGTQSRAEAAPRSPGCPEAEAKTSEPGKTREELMIFAASFCVVYFCLWFQKWVSYVFFFFYVGFYDIIRICIIISI